MLFLARPHADVPRRLFAGARGRFPARGFCADGPWPPPVRCRRAGVSRRLRRATATTRLHTRFVLAVVVSRASGHTPAGVTPESIGRLGTVLSISDVLPA